MDSPTTTITSSTPSTSSAASSATSSSSEISSLFSTLLRPTLSLRSRSRSNASFTSSRSVTPVPSISPSISIAPPHPLDENAKPSFLHVVPIIVDYLDVRDILSLSCTTRHCLGLRKLETFERHLAVNGWDTDALVRRLQTSDRLKGPQWIYVARSALQRDDILELYHSLPKIDAKKSLLHNKKRNRATEKLMRILVDVVTEHDRYNFRKLASLTASCSLSVIQFVTAIPAHNWKLRYRKTFVIAAYVNAQPSHPDAQRDIEELAATLDFEEPNPSSTLFATRANFLYIYGCMTQSFVSPRPLSSIHYDPPHLRPSRGLTLPGMELAIARFKQRLLVEGFYRKTGGDVSSMRVAVEPVGLASRSPLPFRERDLITLTATVSDGEGNPPWQMEGSVSQNTGMGKLKSASGLVYEIWVTPWGVAGQKLLAEGKHLGYFALHWVS